MFESLSAHVGDGGEREARAQATPKTGTRADA
jgi:hypothetical protein